MTKIKYGAWTNGSNEPIELVAVDSPIKSALTFKQVMSHNFTKKKVVKTKTHEVSMADIIDAIKTGEITQKSWQTNKLNNIKKEVK